MKLQLQPPLKEWLITQPFGTNFNTFYTELGLRGHNGLDFRAADSTEVYATHDGRVTYAGYDGAGGLTIVIRTEQQFEDTEGVPQFWKTIYCHLKKDAIKVTGGQTVKVGDVIALSDNTGRSTGAHLHFGLKPIQKGEEDWVWFNLTPDNGYNGAVDPQPYFNRPKYIFTQTLRLGSRGKEVEELQKALYIGPQDGIFGKVTEGAVKRFQTAYKLIPDGVVGQKTREKLNI